MWMVSRGSYLETLTSGRGRSISDARGRRVNRQQERKVLHIIKETIRGNEETDQQPLVRQGKKWLQALSVQLECIYGLGLDIKPLLGGCQSHGKVAGYALSLCIEEVGDIGSRHPLWRVLLPAPLCHIPDTIRDFRVIRSQRTIVLEA